MKRELDARTALAVTWRSRAETLALELDLARRFIDEQNYDERPWWRRWLWALAPCLAISLLLI